MPQKLRVTVSIIVFCLLNLFFLDLIQSVGILAKLQWLPALLAADVFSLIFLSVIALLFGRIYCSTLCPLGTFQDLIIWLAGKFSRKRRRFSYAPAWTKTRYAFGGVLVVSVGAGLPLALALLDPYSIYGRMAAQLLSPAWMSVNNALATAIDPYEGYLLAKKDIYWQSVATLSVSLFSLLLVGGMSWKYGRLYCNTICPVGMLLGLISRISLFNLTIKADRCSRCGVCAAKCKAGCVDVKKQRIDESRCIQCFDCIEYCPHKAIIFQSRFGQNDLPQNQGDSRRRFLASLLFALTGGTVSAKAAADSTAVTHGAVPVLPPGAKNVAHFNAHCTACQLCVSKCPMQVLKPMDISQGIRSVMQPALDFNRSFCDYECNVCGTVCPSRAITRLSVQEKQQLKIGYADIDLNYCLVETEGVHCGNCAIHCPTKAIDMMDDKGKRLPVIDTSLCIGCGSCQYHCPADGNAIQVVGYIKQK